MSNSYLTQLKILYVEDDDSTREALKQFLRKKAGKVVTASDGEEGFRKYEEEKPDIIIADLLLPKLNGMEMLRKIRAAGGKCPVVITSSVEETSTILDAVDVGIVKYVVKPIVLDNLISVLNKVAEELRHSPVIFDDPEIKLELENIIKHDITAFLKKTIGKGPRDLSVFISETSVKIKVFGILTPLEKKILENRHNVSLVEHLRKSYYDVSAPELEHIISRTLQMKAKFSNADFDVPRGNEEIEFLLGDIK